MKIEPGPKKPFTIERAEEIKREIEEVIALIESGEVLDEDFKSKLRRLKTSLSELVRHRIIRIKAKEIITKIETLEQYRNLQQIYSLLQELKELLSNILDNVKNFLLNLHLARSAFEDPEAKSFGAKYLLYLNILNGVYQSIDSVLRKFPRYEDIETRRAGKFFSFDEFLDYLIERIIEALKALEGIEGIENKANIRRRLETVLTKLTLLKAGRVDKRRSLR